MTSRWKCFGRNRRLQKRLINAVMIGLFTAACQPSAMAADYTQGLTGSEDDADFLGDDVSVSEADGGVKYDFSKDAIFRLNKKQNAFGIQLDKDAKATVNGKNLTFDTTVTGKGNSDSTGIHVLEGSTLTINGNVNIQAHNRAGNFSNGINIDKAGTGEGTKTTVTINGNLAMRNADTGNPWGVSSWNIHGGYGPGGSAAGDAPNYTGARWQPTGIRLATGHGSVFTVNGDVDLAVKGTAVTTDPYYADANIADKKLSIVNLNNGNIRIDTPESGDETYYALASYGGTINVNMNKNKDVNINGNLIVMKEHNNSGAPYFYQDGEINLALTNNNSKWTGVVDNSGVNQTGDLNLWLQNGAQWEHRSLSKTNGLQVQNMPVPSIDHYGMYDKKTHVANLYGGADAAGAGFILQKDGAPITVNKYSGWTTLAYAHTGDGTDMANYIGGNFIVSSAAEGSGITLTTDAGGIALTDDNVVNRALNALAGKLYYTGYADGERNLTGKVQIADGLTSSSAVKKLGGMAFEETTGKGKYDASAPQPQPDPNEQNRTEFTAQMTPGAVKEYKDANVEKETGAYTFTKDSTVDYTGDAAVFAKYGGVKIDAAGHNLTVNVKAGVGKRSLWGIDVRPNRRQSKIDVDAGHLTFNINADHNYAVTDAVGIESGYAGGVMTFKGMTEIHTYAKNRSVGADIAGTDSKVQFDGLKVSVNKDAKTAYSLRSRKGTLSVNTADGTPGTSEVQLDGNIAAEASEYTDGHLDVALTRGSSYLHGLSIAEENTWTDYPDQTYTKRPEVKLTLQNGAVWQNENYGTQPVENFTGSYVTQFTGGSDAAHRGIIEQKDTNPLHIGSYGGNTLVFYEHTGNGSEESHYAAGDTIIDKAAENSSITMATGNNGIAMDDGDAVDDALNALAGKLTYKAWANGEKNLAGTVMIADGLTSSSAAKVSGKITYDSAGVGGYANGNQTAADFTAPITGDRAKDKAYIDAHVLKKNGKIKYTFTKDSTIRIAPEQGETAIDVQKDVLINAVGQTLTLGSNRSGLLQYDSTGATASKSEITADKVVVDVNNENSRTDGIYVKSSSLTNKAESVINGSVDVKSHGVSQTTGLYSAGNAFLTVNGDVIMKDANGWAVSGEGNMSHEGISAVYAGSDYTIQTGGHLDVNGNLDLKASANGVLANGGGSTVNIKGGGTIEIDKENESGFMAIAAQSGVANMNMNDAGDGYGTHKVNIKGNLGVTDNSVNVAEPFKDSIVNLGLGTEDSTLHGVVVNNFSQEQIAQGWTGKANLYMAGGATWTNEQWGKTVKSYFTGTQFAGSMLEKFAGSTDAQKPSYIYQKDRRPISIKNYSGNTLIYYTHTGNGSERAHYKAGDVIVGSAAANSGITVATDNTGMNMNDNDKISQALNSLAGKLTYENYAAAKGSERNLKGLVQIADGLTASSAIQVKKDITFDETTGKGGYVIPGPDVIAEHTMPIIEDNYIGDDQRAYWNKLYLRQQSEDGTVYYRFDTNTKLKFVTNKDIGVYQTQGGLGAISWSGHHDGVIDMLNRKLIIDADGHNSVDLRERPSGIFLEGNTLTINRAKGVDITVRNGANTVKGGIIVQGTASNGTWDNGKGRAHLIINNGDDAESAVKLRFVHCDDPTQGIFVDKNTGAAKLEIKGLVDLETDGFTGLVNNRGETYIGGGSLVSKNATSIENNGGITLLNAAQNADGSIRATSDTRDLVVKGNVINSGTLGMAFNTVNSLFSGTAAGNKAASILLANKALWQNESNLSSADRAGSSVNLFGGKTGDTAGYILQKDTKELTLDRFGGSAVVMYAHTGDGTERSHYAAGDTIVRHADSGATLTLSTDNGGMDMTDNGKVAQALNALAGKLTYENYTAAKGGERNLTGWVQIADGLTASSAAQKTGRMTFDETTGKGGYEAETQTVTDFTAPITGDKTADQVYVAGGVRKEKDGKATYVFTKNSNIHMANGAGAAIDVQKDVTVDAASRTLTLRSDSKGLSQTTGKAALTAEKLAVDVRNDAARTDGVYVAGVSNDRRVETVITGTADVKSRGAGAAAGLYSAGNAQLTVDGDVVMNDTDWAVSAKNAAAREDAGAVYAGADPTTQKGGRIDITGGVNLKVDANGLIAKGGGSAVNAAGGTIEINKDNDKGYMAIDAQGGTVSMNMNAAGSGAGDRRVSILGNIGVTNGAALRGDAAKESVVKLGLGTADSTLHGVIVNNLTQEQTARGYTGATSLYMAGGATWINEAYGKTGADFAGSTLEYFGGSSDAGRPAQILQKDGNPLTINNYSGNAIVYYVHTGDGTQSGHYTAGDTIIGKAAAGAALTLSTDNNGVDMSSGEKVERALNALAGKLTYKAWANGEKNLKGLVQIADGLTSSSAVMATGKITYDASGKGGYKKPQVPDHQETVSYTTPLTGDKKKDQEYLYGGVLKDKDGQITYVFTKNSDIQIAADGGAAIDVQKDVTIDAKGSTLTLRSDSSGMKQSDNKTDITADKVIVDVKNEAKRADGIYVMGASSSKQIASVINGTVNVKAHGVSQTTGLYSAGNALLTVNGNVVMKDDNGWAISGQGNASHEGISAVYAGSNYSIQKGGRIDIAGDVDLKVDANGILANGGGSVVNVKGGGTIEVRKDNESGFLAIDAQSGIVNMNMNEKGDGTGAHKVTIKGNLGVTDNSYNVAEPFKDSVINLGLGTADSTLHGVVINNFSADQIKDGYTGKANLYMAGGATWTNEAYGKPLKSFLTGTAFGGSVVENFAGSKDVQNPARIIQKDTHALTLNNYSGNALVYYAHTDDGTESGHYKAGDTIVGKAAADSAITLSTDNSGVNMNDKTKLTQTLNALAGKLTYKAWVNGEKNLSGKVQIADGMTASSAALTTGKITYDDTTGKGSFVGKVDPQPKPQPPEHQTTANFTAPLTGNATKDQAYIDAGVLKENGGKTAYVFTKNTDIRIAANGGAAIDVQKDVAIDAKGSTLTLHSDSKGIKQTENKAEIAADRISVDVNNANGRTEGISVAGASRDKKVETVLNGNVDVKSHGKDYALGIYSAGNAAVKVSGDVVMKDANGWAVDNGNTGYGYYGASGLYAGSDYTIQKGGSIDVAGAVDLKVNGNGIFANGGGSTVNVASGGTIEVNKNSDKGYMALVAQSGVVNMNMNAAGSGYAAHKAAIKGNIGVLRGAVNAAEPFKETSVNLGLGTADSTFHGVVMNNFTDQDRTDGFTGKASLYMAGGSVWTNEAYGQTVQNFAGSVVENFAGSADADRAAHIVQKDTHDLTINNYSGNAAVWYEHSGNGESAGDFKAGSTIIKRAAEGAVVTMSTDSSGIRLENDSAVEKVFDNLAGKLQYLSSDQKESETTASARRKRSLTPGNLTARLQIAEGLTSSSVQRTGTITFNNGHQGNYLANSLRRVGGTVIRGDYETDMMRGTRTAMMTSMLSWRDNESALGGRVSALRAGAPAGAWAQPFGARNKYDGSNTEFTNSTYGVQLGYDRSFGSGWRAGVSFDYQEGSAHYKNGGKGDNKLYGIGIYGSKNLGGGAYLDVAGKVGQVDNDFTAYNMLGQELKGDYKTTGHSLSVQYGKRFGNTAKGYFEPQAQLTWAHLNGKSYDAHRGSDVMHIKQDAFDSFVGRIGIQTGIETARGGVYANISLAHEFSGDVTGSYRANDGGLKRTSYDVGDTWADLTLGGHYSLNRNTNIYADLTRTLCGDYRHQWKAQAGVRVAF